MNLRSYPKAYFELIFVAFILFMGMRLPSAFLPIFAEELDPSGTLVGFAVSSWFFSRIFAELPSGVLADKFGTRKLLLGGLTLSVLGALSCSVSNSINLLIVGRAVWGLGTALFFMSSTVLILDLFKSDMRGRALGTFQGVEVIGGFFGIPIGGYIVGVIGYMGVFLLSSMLILGSMSLALISKSLEQSDTWTGVESQLPIKKTISTLRRWDLNALFFSNLFSALIMVGVGSTIIPLYLNRQLGINIESVGIVMSARTVGFIVAAVTSGHLSDIFGRKPIIVLGTLVQISCLYLYAFVCSFEPFLLLALFNGFGLGMTFTSLTVLLSEMVSAEVRGIAVGMHRTFMDMGGFLGPPFFVLLFRSVGSYITFISAIAMLALNIVFMMAIKSKRAR